MVPGEGHQGERILAAFRLLLVAAYLAATYVAPEMASRQFSAFRAVLLYYLLASAAILALVWASGERRPVFDVAIQVTDVICASLACWLGGGPNDPLFLLLILGVAASAYRWGLAAATGTASAIAVSLGLLEIAGGRILGPSAHLSSQPLRIVSLAGTTISLLGIAGLLGYLSERAKARRGQNRAIERLVRIHDPDASIQEMIERAVHGLADLAAASRAVLVLWELASGKVFCWEISARMRGARRQARFSEVTNAERGAYFLDAPESSWCTNRSPESELSGLYRCQMIDRAGRRIPDQYCDASNAFLARQPFQSLYSVGFAIEREWAGRVFLLDPQAAARRTAELGFLQSLAQEVASSIHAVYLLQRLQERARAKERLRLAHELHDGLVQSLIALEVETELLRRRDDICLPVVEGLAQIRSRLRDEIAGVRSLMSQLKAPELTPQEMLDAMSEIVARFRRETGISASFVCESEEVDLPPRVCREVACILQEALANVRKHSGAHNVQVQFASNSGCFELAVADDGQGFPLSGRWSLSELQSAARGPVVLQERARAIGAQVAIESVPGQGSRVEVRLREAYG